jgi:hypothetical protein
MSDVLTGSDGAFRFEGQIINPCRGWTLNIQREKIDTTGLAVYDRTYKQTLRATTGSAIVLYDPNIPSHSSLFNRILNDTSAVDEIHFVFYNNAFESSNAQRGAISGDCLIDSMSVPMNVGEAMATTLNFTIQGKARGQF